MKTREEYVRPFQIEFEEYVQHVTDVCKDAGYSSFDEAHEKIMSQPVSGDEDVTLYNGFFSADRYWISTLGQGLYEYEKQLIKAHKRYDRIIERLASKPKYKYNSVVVEELLEMKRRDERVRRLLEEANSRYDEMIDELVSKYKSDVEEED